MDGWMVNALGQDYWIRIGRGFGSKAVEFD